MQVQAANAPGSPAMLRTACSLLRVPRACGVLGCGAGAAATALRGSGAPAASPGGVIAWAAWSPAASQPAGPRAVVACAARRGVAAAGSGERAEAGGPKLLLVDGHILAFRSFYGLPALTAGPGGPATTVAFGVLRSLLALLEAERPDAVLVAFDTGAPSFRAGLLPSYKAQRAKAPPDFGPDLERLRLLLRHLRVPTVSGAAGFEADDVLAGVAQAAASQGWVVRLVSTDRDLWQVVRDPSIAVLLPTSGGGGGGGGRPKPRPRGSTAAAASAARLIDEAAVQQQLGVSPAQVPDYKALAGDASDNLKGVPGIGPKTAAELLTKHGSLQGVLAALEAGELKPGVAAKLQGQQAAALLFRDIATVRPTAAPSNVRPQRLAGFSPAEVEPLLRKLQLTSIINALPRLLDLLGGEAAPSPELAEALPVALQQLDAAASASRAQDEQEQAAADAPGTTSSQLQAAEAPAAATAAAAGAALPAAPARRLEGAVGSTLPDSVQASCPAVTLVTSHAELDALVARLRQEKARIAWCWPQHAPYQPGRAAPAPGVICAAWQPAQQPAGPTTAAPGAPASAPAPPARRPVLPRRRRSTPQPTSQQEVQQAGEAQPGLSSAQAAPRKAALLQTEVPCLAAIVAGEGLPASELLAGLKGLLESEAQPKALFESKRGYTELAHHGISLEGVEFDVLVAGCLPDPEAWTGAPETQQATVLPAMAQHVLGASLRDMAAALREAGTEGDSTAAAAALPGAVWDAAAAAWACHLLAERFSAQLEALCDGGQLARLFRELEVPLQRVLASMELRGIRCDTAVLQAQREDLQEEAAQLKQQLFTLAGEVFNPAYAKDRSRIIFDTLQLRLQHGQRPTRTKSGYYSTSLDEVEKLEPHPFKDAYLQWNRLNSLLTKYYNDAYFGAVQPHTGRVHTTYHQVGVSTGRLASSNPNLQNLPQHDPRGRRFRTAFLPSPGHVLVSADYSQVELRVLAGLSGDEALNEAFASGRDAHSATAREVLNKGREDPVAPAERQMGKRINFGIVYGVGVRQLAAEAGITQAEAQQFLDRFQAAHPRLFEYMANSQRCAVSRGYTSSVLGRRRVFRFQAEQLQQLRGALPLAALPDAKGLRRLGGKDDAQVLRQAGNAPIQGTSADVLKAAMLQLHRELLGPPHNCHLLLTVHDEVILEVPREQVEPVCARVARIMEGVLPQHRLLLKVNVTAGDSWLECS